ncbi:cadherin-13-like [Haplochromis burtoni]|uniref:cadherin-13-like n=1 Tax=Haplochromis burtoni TaxID=8153 RepID=UPI001C2D979A|nr:cadherin-13-like [Haplochromis burtoni]
MEIGVCVLLAFLLHQVAHVGGQGDGGHEGCVPGFQVKKYQVMYRGPFQKGQRLLQVEFDDCAGNEDVTFGVSDPGFHVDGDLNLVGAFLVWYPQNWSKSPTVTDPTTRYRYC